MSYEKMIAELIHKDYIIRDTKTYANTLYRMFTTLEGHIGDKYKVIAILLESYASYADLMEVGYTEEDIAEALTRMGNGEYTDEEALTQMEDVECVGEEESGDERYLGNGNFV